MRPDVRAALALEEAGELDEAARVFERAGEHAQAALLRLEHARTVRDSAERLDILRQGCARNPGSTAEARTLQLALAEALLDERSAHGDTARRRAMELEAARALDEAGQASRAGELFEGLGLLRQAAASYERGGEVARLEVVLEVIERLDHAKQTERELLQQVDDAVAAGQRRLAQSILAERTQPSPITSLPTLGSHAADPRAPTHQPPPSSWLLRSQELDDKLIAREQVDLRWGQGRVTAVRMRTLLAVGRSPSCDVTVPGTRVSRHHVELRIDASSGRPQLVAIDQGSRVGTFWEGLALAPGDPMPLSQPGELALGTATAVEVVPVRSSANAVIGGLLRAGAELPWVLFLPAGGPLWLAPGIQVPARIFFDRGLVTFDLAAGVDAKLHDRVLGPGANLEFMRGDRLCLIDAPLCLEVLA